MTKQLMDQNPMMKMIMSNPAMMKMVFSNFIFLYQTKIQLKWLKKCKRTVDHRIHLVWVC